MQDDGPRGICREHDALLQRQSVLRGRDRAPHRRVRQHGPRLEQLRSADVAGRLQRGAARHQFDPALPSSRAWLADHLDDLGQRALSGDELQGEPVHAIAKTGRPRAIVKHMAQMGFTTSALNLGSLHAMRIIGGINNTSFTNRFIKAGPAATTFKFSITFEQRISTNCTIVRSFFSQTFIRAAPGSFRAFHSCNIEDVFGQYFFPFCIRDIYFACICIGVKRMLFRNIHARFF